MTRQNWKHTQDSNESSFENRELSLEFRVTNLFLYSPHERISRNDLFLEKRNNNHSHVQRTQRPIALACTIKAKLSSNFWARKKEQLKVFYLEVWKIDAIFLYQVYLFNYQNWFYICEGLCLRASRVTA